MPNELKETEIKFTPNAQLSDAARYLDVTVDVAAVLISWKYSLFSFEWLKPDGSVKPMEDLPEREQPKRAAVEEKLKQNQAIEKPVLGIGIMDNVEIGMGRAEFLTLAAHGVRRIAVHIPKSNESDFKPYRADIS